MRGIRVKRGRGHYDADGYIDDVPVDERIVQVAGLVFNSTVGMWA